MAYIFTENEHIIVQLPMVEVREGEVREEEVELVLDASGKVVKGPYTTVEEALNKALDNLAKALREAEDLLDKLEYRLETEEKVDPGEVYTASYMAHHLHYAAIQLYAAAKGLLQRGFIRHRLYYQARKLLRKAYMVRRYARDIRLLHATIIQVSLNASMKKLTWLGTVAMPAVLITSFYGMNLRWLPAADNPPLVFLILVLATALFAYVINKI
jgi:Mg2+ and Co2+ transporter CorA